MSGIVPSGGAIVRPIAVKDWRTFCEMLGDAVFRTVVLNAIATVGGEPDDDIRELEQNPKYFADKWPLISGWVEREIARLVEQRQVDEQAVRRSRGNQVLAEQFAMAFGVTNSQAIALLVGWLSQHHAPPKLPERPYEAFIKLPSEAVLEYPYADSFEAVLLSHLWWFVPEGYDRARFLQGVYRARYKVPFLYMWAVFGEEIERDHQLRATEGGGSEVPAWVERDVDRAVDVFVEEWSQRARSVNHLPAHPEYGLLNAAVTAAVVRKFNGRMQDFRPSLHAPRVVRELLQGELGHGVTKRNQTRFLSERAREVVETYNRLLRGDPATQAAVDPDILRSLRSLESHEVLLELEASL